MIRISGAFTNSLCWKPWVLLLEMSMKIEDLGPICRYCHRPKDLIDITLRHDPEDMFLVFRCFKGCAPRKAYLCEIEGDTIVVKHRFGERWR